MRSHRCKARAWQGHVGKTTVHSVDNEMKGRANAGGAAGRRAPGLRQRWGMDWGMGKRGLQG